MGIQNGSLLSCLDCVLADREVLVLLDLLCRLERLFVLQTVSTDQLRMLSTYLGHSPPDRPCLLRPQVKRKVFLGLVELP